MTRGQLRVYLGAAPGVGKTFAMLDEGHRRAERGTDVVVAFVETHGRVHTAEKLDGLEIVPRATVDYRGIQFGELDLDAVLARSPEVALVDELAHTNITGSRNDKRWQDVQCILDAGIDVISTVNVQHLESLNDIVEAITEVPQRETVPDSVVRAAEQIELVDMTPEALRRRMAHGNIYSADKIDAALGNYFRPGNLTALRELALLWLANSVEDGLQRYRDQHGITATWETRERIVVALTGGPEGDTLIRRAARIAARASSADLLAVHVTRSDGLVGASIAALDRQRLLVESLGGSYHSVVGDNVPHAILDFARAGNATQIVIGASRRHPLTAAFTGSGTGSTITRLSGSIDVHMVTHDYVGKGQLLPRANAGGITPRRRVAGLICAVTLLAGVTLSLTHLRTELSFESDLCIYLLCVIITSLIGGFYPALAAAIAASVLLNYYFAAPIHTLTIDQRDNVVALVIFVVVTVLVSRVVDLAARRLVVAARASAEAETLSTLAGSLLRGEQALPALLERVRETFGMRSASLLRKSGQVSPAWEVLARVGPDAPETPVEADSVADIDDQRLLATRGRTLRAEDQRLLAAFAAQVAVAYRQRELSDAARAIEPLAATERARTALLNAVGHDLRTPIASAKASVSSLRADDVSWSADNRAELLATADNALDRLTELVTNLLDLSRLEAGVLPVHTETVTLPDVVARAVAHAAGAVRIDLAPELPDVVADAGLLERVVANLVENAVRFSPDGVPVRITANSIEKQVELRVIDKGPGIARDDAERVFAAFQRRDDAPAAGNGVGLGLAIARGFATAMGGGLEAETTPGGGATLVVTLPAAPRDQASKEATG